MYRAKMGTLSGGQKGFIIGPRQIDGLSIVAAGHEVIQHPWGVLCNLSKSNILPQDD